MNNQIVYDVAANDFTVLPNDVQIKGNVIGEKERIAKLEQAVVYLNRRLARIEADQVGE